MTRTLLEQVDRTPLAYVILVAYLTMAVVTGSFSGQDATLVRYGAAVGALIQDGEPWRLVSHAFLHAGIIHLGFNALFLVQIGPALEERLGSLRFALLYVTGALGGGVAGALWHFPITPMVGGSGALFGMLGSGLALNMRQGRHLLDFLDYYGPRQLVVLIVANLVLGMLLPMVSNAAHVGGLVAGFALTFCFLDRGRHDAPDLVSRAIQAGWALLLAGAVFYCAFPVLRWDYLGRSYLEATEPAARRAWAEALARASPISPDELSPNPANPDWFNATLRRWREGR